MKKLIKIHKRIFALTTILMMTISLISTIGKASVVQANSNRYVYNGSNLNTSKYPGYKEKLDALRATHPSWTFEIMETGLDWNKTIQDEYSENYGSPYSLISGKSGDWICSSCGTRSYSGQGWYHASESAIAYYMDPRNWLGTNSPYVLQFLKVTYTETSNQNLNNALNGTFLSDGTLNTATTINNVCRETNTNPYYIVARILQEQGTNGGSTWRMNYNGTYYYNLFNIKADGRTESEIYTNGLNYARSQGWDSIDKCIRGSVNILFSNYLSTGQNTNYLNKFDVEEQGGLYHQYMQNIAAPTSESSLMASKLNSSFYNQQLTFVIPVFNNMPSGSAVAPDGKRETGAVNIRVKSGVTDYNVRSERSTSSAIVGTVANHDTVVLSIERYNDGWHRVVLTNGVKGYIYFNTAKWEEINDVTNCNEKVVLTGDGVYMRAGPGLDEGIITSLYVGQIITRIDNTGRYNFNGYIWDRIVLDDGRQGFVARRYLEKIEQLTPQTNMKKNDETKIITIEPDVTESNIKSTYGEMNITKANDEAVSNGVVGTGYKANINGTVYTIVKLGDANGDGVINSGDLLKIKKHLMNVISLNGTSFGIAADANHDGAINSGDLLKVKKYLMNVSGITVN